MQFSFMSLSAAAVRQYTKAHSAPRLSVCQSVWLSACVVGLQWSRSRSSSTSSSSNDNKLNCQIPKPDSTSYIMAYACYLRLYKPAASFLPAHPLCALPHTRHPPPPPSLCLSLSPSLAVWVILLRLKLLILLSPKLHIYARV